MSPARRATKIRARKPSAPRARSVRAFAPATVSNLAVGFDLLGHAVEGVGDEVTVTRLEGPGLEVELDPAGVCQVPADPKVNTASVALAHLIEELSLPHGFRVRIRKGIPLGSGLGGSAASAVGAVVAASALLDRRVPESLLLEAALAGEAAASGAAHPDNVVPSLMGGLRLCVSNRHEDVIEIPVPDGLKCVLVHPDIVVSTKAARQMLKPQIFLKDHVHQSAFLGAFLAGCFKGDLALIGRSMVDLLVEPQRSVLIPGFDDCKAAALRAGALGCSISGSGPTVFAWTRSRDARKVRDAMAAAFEGRGLATDSWVSPIGGAGARVIR